MKSKSNPFLRRSLVLAASSAFLTMGSAQAATYDWDGDTNSNFSDGANWVGGTWTQWDDYRFGAAPYNTPTNASITIDGYFGMNSLTLLSTLSTDIVINSTSGQPVIMGVGVNGNPSALITIADNKNLTINGDYIAATAVTWNIGTGGTLTLNGPLNNWNIGPSAAAAIVKDGAGSAVLTQKSNYTGGTTVNGGTFSFADGDWQTGQPWDGSGATGAISVGSGASLSTSAGVTQIKNGLTLDGGTVSSRGNLYGTGNGSWGNLLLSSNITAGNSATSLISSEIRLDADRLIDVGSGSTLNISGGIAISPFGGNYGITKTGDGTLTLTAANTYTGNTTVNGGTLSLGNGASSTNLADSATVSIAFGTTVNLNFTGTDTVGKLIIDGETVPGGIYDGSLATPLPYRSYFTGSGSLTVVNQNGTWTSTAGGNWSDSANWLANAIATGADKTATFSAGTGSEAITVSLDSNREIANLAFSNANYTINGNTLTLDSSTTLSTLSVASGNTATISSALAGTPNLDKTGVGTLTLSGGLSYSGTTTVSAGTLNLQDMIGGGGSNYNGSNININGASTLRVSGLRYNFNGKTFTFDSVGGGTIDAIASGAGGLVFEGTNTFFTSGGAQNIISGTKGGADNLGFNLNGQTAIFEVETGSDATSDLKFIGTIWNGGNVTKNGAGRLEFSAAQQYSGNTTINDGTLILGDGTNNIDLPNGGDVIIESGATLKLNYSIGNSDSIDELSLGGVLQSPGVYGAGIYSGVTITGTGTLTVLNGPITDPFANWMSTNYPTILNPDNEPGADPDNDGIKNLMEYVLQGGNPSVSTTGTLPTLNATGANFVFTYFRRAAATGTTQTFEYGTTLSGWTPVAIPGGAGVTVIPNTPSAGIDKVEIIVAKGANTKLFGRLQVVK